MASIAVDAAFRLAFLSEVAMSVRIAATVSGPLRVRPCIVAGHWLIGNEFIGVTAVKLTVVFFDVAHILLDVACRGIDRSTTIRLHL